MKVHSPQVLVHKGVTPLVRQKKRLLCTAHMHHGKANKTVTIILAVLVIAGLAWVLRNEFIGDLGSDPQIHVEEQP